MGDVWAAARPSHQLQPGSHVCWIVTEVAEYVDQAVDVLLDASEFSQKPIVFGPESSESRAELAPLASVVMDPRTEVLAEGELSREKMFTWFREQVTAARAEGYQGLRVMADMDWLVAARPSIDQLVEFEMLLGALARELDASIICAYRKSSFTPDVTTAMLSVHEIEVGGEPPKFKMYADHRGSWTLSGEIDLAVATTFETAITHAIDASGGMIDLSDLRFIDVAGVRQIARAARTSEQPVRLIGAPPIFRRMWDLGDFAAASPSVELIDG